MHQGVRGGVFGLVFVLFFAVLPSAFGQASTSLRGTVQDPAGAVVPGAAVTLTSAETQNQRTTATGAAGDYQFLLVPPGAYVLTVSAKGFERQQLTSLHLLVNTPATVNVSLSLGKQSDVVSVTAEAPPLNLSDASLGITFTENQVRQIPLEGRNVPDLLSLQAGVVYTGNRPDLDRDFDTRSGAVNGARSDQSNVTLDGVDVNDEGNGYAFTSVLPVTIDSVQEFRVTTTNYNADQGRSSGAQVALVTKSGSNNFHGSLYEYNRNTATSANDYFVKNAELASGQPNVPPKLIRNIFGGSVGGPIVKDRLFFFVNYEGTRQREENSVVRTVPSATLRQGILQYQDVNGGITTLTPQQIIQLDPLHLGPNAAVLSYFNTYPLPNDNSVGDGLNFSGFRFRGPISIDKDYYIARADYRLTQDGKHTLFWRGALQNIDNSGVPFLPGDQPEQTQVDYSKGFVAGYTAVLTPALVNNFRWGFTRQSVGINGNSTEPWITFRGLDQGIFRSHNFQMPVNNFLDDLSWTRGRHSLQFGTNIARVRDPRNSSEGSYSDGSANSAWLDTGGFANTNSPLSPDAGGFPAVDPAFNNAYDFPMIALLGMVTEVDAYYNYDKQGNLLPQGAPVKRNFGFDSFEWYAQDAFHIKPNLTITYGLRYSLYSPPWETNGLQVAPSISLGQLFDQRQQEMQQGIPSNTDPLITFNLAGPANGKPGYYNWDKKNFAPRLALAYSPRAGGGFWRKILGENDSTVIRAGFGIVHDRIGLGLLNTFDQNGSFGLATGISNPAAVQTAESSPRLADLHTIPVNNNNGQVLFIPAPPGTFPQTPPYTLDTGGFAIAWGLDDKIKTPRSMTFDFSLGRELAHGFSIEASYVGRLSDHLLTQRDLMMPLDLVDKKTGIDYFAAAQKISQLYRANTPTSAVTAASVGSTAAYWKDMVQGLKKGGAYSLSCSGGSTLDVVQAVYDLYSCYAYNDTTSLSVLDLSGISDANLANVSYFPTSGPNSFFNKQYSSLYAWSTIGDSSYHSLQINLRKHFSAGVQFDFNYTFSKSIDISSDAERIRPWGGLGGQVINSWSPNQLRAVSDFDTPHQINANWIVELPFGRGKKFVHQANGWADAVIGGWQLSGLARWTSGFPVNVDNGYFFPTNWQLEGNANTIAPVSTGTTKMPDGTVSMFTNGPAAIASFDHPLPGQSGARNTFRGDGFAGLDMGLSKRWKVPHAESNSVQFRWEVFNVPNLKRFDVQSNRPEVDLATEFGNYTNLLTQPRVMQFALRYEF